MTKKGFVFDLDGVITDTAKFHFTAWRDLAGELGITIDETFNESLKGISRSDSLNKILIHGNKESEFSNLEKEKLAEKKNNQYLSLLNHLSPADVLPGVQLFLNKARQAQIPCAIASASQNAPYILERLKLDSYFKGIVNPRQLSQGKPHPEIFIKAAQMIGILPNEAVGFEDAQAGIDGMKDCGMYAVGIVTNEPIINADITCHHLTDLDFSKLLVN